MPELRVERRQVSRPRRAAAVVPLARRQPRREDGGAPRVPRRRVQGVPLPHDHELLQDVPQAPQPGEGDRRDQASDVPLGEWGGEERGAPCAL